MLRDQRLDIGSSHSPCRRGKRLDELPQVNSAAIALWMQLLHHWLWHWLGQSSLRAVRGLRSSAEAAAGNDKFPAGPRGERKAMEDHQKRGDAHTSELHSGVLSLSQA